MKFTLSWLKEHLETDASVADILYALTDLGLEVEEVSNPAERLRDFTIGKVTRAEKSRCGQAARLSGGDGRRLHADHMRRSQRAGRNHGGRR